VYIKYGVDVVNVRKRLSNNKTRFNGKTCLKRLLTEIIFHLMYTDYRKSAASRGSCRWPHVVSDQPKADWFVFTSVKHFVHPVAAGQKLGIIFYIMRCHVA